MTNTLATRKQSQAIRERMQKIRSELPSDADAARARVQELTDWKYHMRRHPWPIVATAAFVGYLLVPAKRQEQVVVHRESQGSNPPPAAKKSFLGGIVGTLATLAIKQGTTLATRQLSNAFLGSVSRQGASESSADYESQFERTRS